MRTGEPVSFATLLKYRMESFVTTIAYAHEHKLSDGIYPSIYSKEDGYKIRDSGKQGEFKFDQNMSNQQKNAVKFRMRTTDPRTADERRETIKNQPNPNYKPN